MKFHFVHGYVALQIALAGATSVVHAKTPLAPSSVMDAATRPSGQAVTSMPWLRAADVTPEPGRLIAAKAVLATDWVAYPFARLYPTPAGTGVCAAGINVRYTRLFDTQVCDNPVSVDAALDQLQKRCPGVVLVSTEKVLRPLSDTLFYEVLQVGIVRPKQGACEL